MVSCKLCICFIPDKIGDGSGIGRCKVYSESKRKGTPENTLKSLLMELGNSPDNEIFWGGALNDRECNRYKVKL